MQVKLEQLTQDELDDMIAALRVLTWQYLSSEDCILGGNLTNEGFLWADKILKKLELK